MGDPSVDVTDENREASQEAKGRAMEAISEGIVLCNIYQRQALISYNLFCVI